jgi:transaldolase/glucose-6-phosphate isomerase
MLVTKQRIFAGKLDEDVRVQLGRARKSNLIREILKKNPIVFRKKEKPHRRIILNRLGWLDTVRRMPDELERIENLVRQVRDAGVKHVFILGMGGSSLCAEVFGEIFGKKGWLQSYTVIDTTAPSRIDAVLKKTDLWRSFFIISCKSGTTLETISQYRFFFKKMKELRPLKAGNFFAAITDEKSDLHHIARRNRFREIFINSSDIGGRYSALSFFGLVPGAFTRANLKEILLGADRFLSHLEESGNDNDALALGVLLGAGASAGVDKLCFRPSPRIAPFVSWVEQLIAESTGKEQKGIIPIEGEGDGPSIDGAGDRIHVYFHVKGDPVPAGMPSQSRSPKGPTVVIKMNDIRAIGAEVLKWEMATAVASIIMNVNPFDEPNVAESKKNTAAILKARSSRRRVPPQPVYIDAAEFEVNSISDLTGLSPRQEAELSDIWHSFLGGVRKGDYISILCYTEMVPEIEERLSKLRGIFTARTGEATLRGYGPRFLHSLGQLYKGGAPKGHFLVLEREYEIDFDVPKLNTTFGKLINAQAEGDIKALRKRHRPLVHINLKENPLPALDKLIELVGRSS